MKYNLTIKLKNSKTIDLVASLKDIENLQHAYNSINDNCSVIYWMNDVEINVKDIDYFMFSAEV